MDIYVTLTILTEHGNLSLLSWYLRAIIVFVNGLQTYNFGQIDIFLLFDFKVLKYTISQK